MKNNNLLGVNNDFKIDFIENFIRLSKVNTYINEAGKNVQIIDYSFEPVNVTKKEVEIDFYSTFHLENTDEFCHNKLEENINKLDIKIEYFFTLGWNRRIIYK